MLALAYCQVDIPPSCLCIGTKLLPVRQRFRAFPHAAHRRFA